MHDLSVRRALSESLGGVCTALLFALLCAPAAVADDLRLPELGVPGAEALPLHKERELGAEVMQQVRRYLPLHQDPEINQYIRDLGRRLAAHSDQPHYGFSFFIVEDDRINAFAMPGGYIGLHTRLIRETTDESELAGVIAHEIAHVTERHIARSYAQARRLNLQSAAAILGAILIGSHNPQAGSAAAMASIAAPIQQQLKHSRDHEHQADRVGIRILANADLDPHGMPRFFSRLSEASRFADHPPEYLSTHPLTQRRLVEAQDLAARLDQGGHWESGHHGFIRARLVLFALSDTGRDEAVAHFRDRLEQAREPTERSAARYGLALALSQQQGEHDRALALLDTLQPHDAERLYPLLGRGEILRAAGRYSEALAVYEKALSLYPDNSAALYRKAETLLRADQPEAARQLLAGTRRDTKHPPELLRLLAEAAHASDRPAEGYIALAHYYYALNDLTTALAHLRSAVRAADAEPYQRARAEALGERWRQER